MNVVLRRALEPAPRKKCCCQLPRDRNGVLRAHRAAVAELPARVRAPARRASVGAQGARVTTTERELRGAAHARNRRRRAAAGRESGRAAVGRRRVTELTGEVEAQRFTVTSVMRAQVCCRPVAISATFEIPAGTGAKLQRTPRQVLVPPVDCKA